MALLLLAPIDWFFGKQPQKEENTKIEYNTDKEDHKKTIQILASSPFPGMLYFWGNLHVRGPVLFFSGVVFLDIVFIFRPFSLLISSTFLDLSPFLGSF